MKCRDSAAWKKLAKLSKTPPDLTKSGTLSEDRIASMKLTALNLKMLYATERVDEKICQALAELAKQTDVLERMDFLQNMEIMNYVNNYESEKRMVGHTAIRHPNPGNEYSDHVHQASKDYQMELEKLQHFLPKAQKFKHMIVVGIGGSYLGTLAVYEALKNCYQTDKTLHFASNVDPDKVFSILREINLTETLVVVISKSGETLEIRAQETLLRKRFEEANLDPKKHFIAVTKKDGPMDKPGFYRECFYMWDFIGGRYSVSSMVGAVPLSFMFGMDAWHEFLRGLHDMDIHALKERDPMKNMPLWGALLGIWNRNFLQSDTFAVVPYAEGMDFWSLHLQQLFMESNGKSVCKETGEFIDWETSPVIWGTVGTEGQHSYYQAIHQGTQVIPMEFIGFKHSQFEGDEVIEHTSNQEKLLANLFAQAIALAKGSHAINNNKYFPGNRPSHILLADRLDAYTLGNLLAYYEHYVAFQGFIWGVNSFDQEGVQLGKILAEEILHLYATRRETGSYPMKKGDEAAIAFMKQLDQMKGSAHAIHHRLSA
jgi:glucose-6-phosphate isomerase